MFVYRLVNILSVLFSSNSLSRRVPRRRLWKSRNAPSRRAGAVSVVMPMRLLCVRSDMAVRYMSVVSMANNLVALIFMLVFSILMLLIKFCIVVINEGGTKWQLVELRLIWIILINL